MARQLRLEYEGAIYHITVRSNGRDDLFRDDKDRACLLNRLKECAEQHGVRIYLFCLMANHFHLVVETPKGNLSRFMQSVLTGYTVYFNLRHRRHGHVTQGRYGARVVAGDDYLLKLSRYVHLNPVHVKGIKDLPLEKRLEVLRRHEWSSYPGYSGTGRQYDLVEEEPMLELVGGRGEGRRKVYQRFVEDGLRNPDEAFEGEMWRSARSIGDEKFRGWVDDCYRTAIKGHKRIEDVAFRKEARKNIAAETVLGMVAKECGGQIADLKAHKRDGTVKGIAGMMLVKYSGLMQRDVAGLLGLKTGAGVSYQIRALAAKQKSDEGICQMVARITKKLDQLSE